MSPSTTSAAWQAAFAPLTERATTLTGRAAILAAAAPTSAPFRMNASGRRPHPSTNTRGTEPVARSGGTWKSVSAASSKPFVKVRSRAICSASAKEANEPSFIGIFSVHSHAWPVFPFMSRPLVRYAPGRRRVVMPGASGRSSEMTMRVNVCSPAGYGVNGTPARRATVARSVASTIVFALIAWRPLRFAITTPATTPDASRRTSVTYEPVMNPTPFVRSARSNACFTIRGVGIRRRASSLFVRKVISPRSIRLYPSRRKAARPT